MHVHQPITIRTPTTEEWSGNGHCGQLCSTNTVTSQVWVVLHHSKSHAVAVKTMHCQYELFTMWLDTMAPTLNSFNFSTVIT